MPAHDDPRMSIDGIATAVLHVPTLPIWRICVDWKAKYST